MEKDRYVTFSNIDCYLNSVLVLDAMHELFTLHPESKNPFWERFMEQIPLDYQTNYCKDGSKDILYQVCSNVFYIFELFDHYEFQKGYDLLEDCELECC